MSNLRILSRLKFVCIQHVARCTVLHVVICLFATGPLCGQPVSGAKCIGSTCVSPYARQLSRTELSEFPIADGMRVFRLQSAGTIVLGADVFGREMCSDPRMTVTRTQAGVVDASGRAKIEIVVPREPLAITPIPNSQAPGTGRKEVTLAFGPGQSGQYFYAFEYSCQMPNGLPSWPIIGSLSLAVDIPFKAGPKAGAGLAIPIKPRAPIPPRD